MKKKPVLGLAGATGVVGNEILVSLEESEVEFADLRLLASEESEGEVYSCRDTEYKVERLEDDSFESVDIAIFALNSGLAAQYVPIAVQAGARVIDTSTHFRGDADVPLVIADINPEAITGDKRIISVPTPTVTILAPVLQALHRQAGLKRVVLSTYQAVSGAGKAALDELWSQTLAIFNQRAVEAEAFQHQIAFNCIPQIDVIRSDGYTKEETRVVDELRKILGLPDLKMTVTAVRVPVFHSYCLSVNLEFERECTVEQCQAVLGAVKGLEVAPDATEYPMPLTVTGSEAIHVGRIRRDASIPYGLNLWMAADNVRRCAAITTVETVKAIIERIG